MIETPKFWYKKNLSSKIQSILFFPLSILWILISLLKNILTKSNFEIVKDHWNITEEGDIDKKNILYINKSLEEIAVDKNLPIQEIEDTVNNICLLYTSDAADE